MTLITDGEIDLTLPITDLPIIFWRNVVTTTNITADTEDPDFPLVNIANPSLGLKWRQDFTGSPAAMPDYITVNISGAGPINFVAIAGHNFATAGVTVALEGTGSGASPEHQDSPPEAEYITGFIPADDGPIVLMFAEVETGMLRLRIQSAGVTAAELAVLYVGKAMVLEEGIQGDHTPLPLARTHKVLSGRSESGSFLGHITVSAWVESTASIANMSLAFARDELIPFLEDASENPFFYAWSPETYPDETAFAWLSNDPQVSFDIDGYAAVELAMRGLVD